MFGASACPCASCVWASAKAVDCEGDAGSCAADCLVRLAAATAACGQPLSFGTFDASIAVLADGGQQLSLRWLSVSTSGHLGEIIVEVLGRRGCVGYVRGRAGVCVALSASRCPSFGALLRMNGCTGALAPLQLFDEHGTGQCCRRV